MTENKGFIAVHCGAGYHKKSLHPKYKKLCRKACTSAGEILNSGGSALDACQVAVMILEDHPIANAGYGSNLTYSGAVECDASIMDGKTLNFGACGAVRGVKYPIALASQICKNQSAEGPLGLVPPSLLVGPGAYDYAKLNNVLIVIDDKKLVAKRALLKHKKHKRLLHKTLNNSVTRFFPTERLDTVGAVCVDSTGHVSAASSSGGIFLKYDGRVGQAATYACGAWADSFDNTSNNSIAVTTTGTGEYLVRTMLAKELADGINNSSCPVTAFQKTFRDKFLDSRYLKSITSQKLAGALVVNVTPSGEGDFMWGHSTKSMAFAYLDTSTTTLKSMVSELPDELVGQSLLVSGGSFARSNHLHKLRVNAGMKFVQVVTEKMLEVGVLTGACKRCSNPIFTLEHAQRCWWRSTTCSSDRIR